MIGSQTALDHPWLVALGWLVVLSLLATVIPALALAAWRLLRRAAPAPVQYRAAMLGFGAAAVLALVAVPLLLVVPASRGARAAPPGMTSTGPPVPADRGPTPAEVAAPVAPAPPRPDPFASAVLSPAILGLVAIAWAAGAALLLSRLLFALIAAHGLRQRATLVDPSPLRDTFERLCAEAHLEGTVLAVSTEVDAPVTVGVRAPAVLVPAHLLDVMPEQGLSPILVHELAHVARRDYTANLAQSVVEGSLCHCPGIWWIGARIREAREFCCDDISVGAAGDRARYVEALTLVARLGTVQHARPAVGMAGPRLITRVRRLLEGEPTMSMPIARASLVAAALIVVTAAMSPLFSVASRHLSAQLLAAGRSAEGAAVPYGFPQRQEGSALRILRVSSTDAHVCGTFEVQNTSTVRIDRVRFVGVLSFKAASKRPVQVLESDWVSQPVAPGTTVRVDASLVDAALARREGRGEHVQAFCAIREIAYANGATWGVTPNGSAMVGNEALEQSRPTLPRAFVGQSHALALARTTLCVDDKGAEYSHGAQIAIRDEPGSAARCAADGQWIEVDARTGDAVAPAEERLVAFEVLADGLSGKISMKGTSGELATLRLADGAVWGLVPAIAANGDVAIALHDMSATPHRLLGTRVVPPGGTARFDEVSPVVTVTLAQD